jgi:flagellar biosynthesis/type III secretory pathway protein FliH
MSNDSVQREIYEMRAKILKDKVSALNKAMEKGIQQGIEQGIQKGLEQGSEQGEKNKAIAIAKNLLDVLDDEIISLKTGLLIEEVEKLRKN